MDASPVATAAKPSKSVGRLPWLGPHFYVDLIRMARKGWPTLARIAYLSALLVSLAFMYETRGATSRAMHPSHYALLADQFATALIVVQNLLVLVLAPVYVASAIAEEKEKQTLEALTLTQLTDRELVLGKLAGRLVHVAALALSSLPILAFLHLWGNVDLGFLAYHVVNTLLLLITAGSVCIYISTNSDSVFQAVSGSYPWMALIALAGILCAFLFPWFLGGIISASRGGGDIVPSYAFSLPMVALLHLLFIRGALGLAIAQMETFRKTERKKPMKTSGSLALTDAPTGPEPKPGKRGQVRSRIHPWAWPIRGDALWWKECIKDGTTPSLSVRWLLYSLLGVAAVAVPWGIVRHLSEGIEREGISALAFSWTFTFYFISLGAYALVVIFQMTMSVAGEREQDTLTTLLMIPEDRREILLAKWAGPWWRNWPILALSGLGVLFGLFARLYSIQAALLLFIAPVPFLLMIGGVALWLSVVCRRVLYANIGIVGLFGLLLIAHFAAGVQARGIFSFYVATIGGTPIDEFVKGMTWTEATLLTLGEQTVFLAVGIGSLWAAFRTFTNRDYAGT